MAHGRDAESAANGDVGWVLGLGGSTHDFSAALAQGPDIRVAIEEERLSRVKYGFGHWFDDPAGRCVRYCLEAEGIKRADLRAVVSSDLFPYRAREFYSDLEFTAYPHHLTHAASACMMLPPAAQRAAVIVYDGGQTTVGEAPPLPCTSTAAHGPSRSAPTAIPSCAACSSAAISAWGCRWCSIPRSTGPVSRSWRRRRMLSLG